MSLPSSLPRFAVVGHPNKGKSSIVATLAQDDSVYIDRVSGATRVTRHYPMQVDGEVLYELIDTPGFQRARAALAWLEDHCDAVAQRPDAVRAFCENNREDKRFFNGRMRYAPSVKTTGRTSGFSTSANCCGLWWKVPALFMWWMARTPTGLSTKRKWRFCAGPANPAWP